MKIYIITDMEGCAGVVNHDDWVVPSGRFYDEGRKILTEEVNAAVDGFFAAGATSIDVIDGHGAGGVHPPLLDVRARFARIQTGYPFMLDRKYDAMAFIGQHAKAGTKYAYLCHTGWFNVLDKRINGVSIGEYGTLVFIGAAYGTTTILASGDHMFALEAQELVKGVETVAVKSGLTADDGARCDCDAYRNHNVSAVHIHPERARKFIRDSAERALRRFITNPESFITPRLEPPYVLETEYREDNGTPAHATRIEDTDIVRLFTRRE